MGSFKKKKGRVG